MLNQRSPNVDRRPLEGLLLSLLSLVVSSTAAEVEGVVSDSLGRFEEQQQHENMEDDTGGESGKGARSRGSRSALPRSCSLYCPKCKVF